jgi:hypothetical protein
LDRYTAGVYLKTSPLFIVDGDTPEAAIEKAKAAGKQLADQLFAIDKSLLIENPLLMTHDCVYVLGNPVASASQLRLCTE